MADFDRKARRARLRLLGIGVAAAAVLTAGGIVAVTSLGDEDAGNGSKANPSPSVSSTAGSPGKAKEYTPATAARMSLLKAKSNADGIGTGFPNGALGATSAAVSYWEGLDLLDDVIARKQWTAIADKDSPETIDQGVSEVRKVREGVGLPPSGGTPDGVTFSTSVKAVLANSLDKSGEVVVVWMVYDRFATVRDKGADNNPLRDEDTNLIVKWDGTDWKVTTEAKYTAKVEAPRSYHPDSKWAFAAGWREVSSG
ncbi:hypothetical protein P1P68_06005 [Streptomyces scabiei]|uniref:hypothetical protein n=1 Tax=Streptomyces scabiei TaxID=1930 RepID=UPI00299043A5|nr:hypothetical protein [Streptomyces scabiei]MDW8804356.1 hypothetical protein [Streptomyces scabiei]